MPYRGGAPAATDLLSGKIQMTRLAAGGGGRAGPGRQAAAARRHHRGAAPPLLPEVPTVAETMPGFEVALWNGLLAPAGTPPAAIARLAAETAAALRGRSCGASSPSRAASRWAARPRNSPRFIRAEIPQLDGDRPHLGATTE